MSIRYVLSVIFFLAASCATAQVHDPQALVADPAKAETPIAPLLNGLGDHHFRITTTSERSQLFFDQGFNLAMGFNHSEALRAFKEAARLDPNNAMAYWGWALVLGPNLNLPMQDQVVKQAYRAIQTAMSLKHKVSDKERAYIEALAMRYSDQPSADRSGYDKRYVAAMTTLVERYPDDLDAATLYAAAMMNTNPWDYWYRDGSPKPQTELVLTTLRSVIDRDPTHAGAHHYLIHTVEAYRPEMGVASADILGSLMPSAGHLVHMPSHIYMRVGRYADAYRANELAVKADEGYITQCRAQGLYPLAYYPHNLHFQVWSAMFQGRAKAALAAAKKIADKIPRTSKENTWALNEAFRSQVMFVLVRFGRWDEMLAFPQPKNDAHFMKGVWHYGRGLAFAHQGKLHQSKKSLKKLKRLRAESKANSSYFIGFGAAGGLLEIAEQVLQAEIAVKQNDFHRATAHLDKAVRLEDGLLYNEPPDWYFPVRHILGAVLLEAGLPAEAEVVYWEDLRRNPNNGYALFGLEKSLTAQGHVAVAAEIESRFKLAWKDADTALTTSRY